jgi:rare lipoprotein A
VRIASRPALWVFLALLFAGGCSHGHRAGIPTTAPPAPQPDTSPFPPPSKIPQPSAPLRMIEEGNASWYGVPYHGRKAANGEIYDMYKLTAAHRTLPFETIVRVTNLRNGKQTQVRINDRGPFVEGRIIDLSLAAAREIDMVGTGVARVRLELVSGPAAMNGAFTVQVGAFLQRVNADKLRQSLERRYQPVFVFEYDSPKGMFYRVRVGRVASEAAANRLADKLRAQESLTTFVVRLDENLPKN